jgi:hypothetical protein
MGQKAVEQFKGPRPLSPTEPAAEAAAAATAAITNEQNKNKLLISAEGLPYTHRSVRC